MKLIIVSGRSGSGKSICLRVLEDQGFYCIDNLPVDLLTKSIEEMKQQQENIAVSIDARNLPKNLPLFDSILTELKNIIPHCEIIYLDATDDTLLKRFSETRRKHPLTTEQTPLREALSQEHQLLGPILECADLRIDTSHLTGHQLSALVRERICREGQGLALLIQSFGYKLGVPSDADFVFDVRCLPNPYWHPTLSHCSGLDPAVGKYLLEQPETQQMLNDIKHFLKTWLPKFIANNRTYLTIAIGCTGGQHRSVFIAEELARFLQKSYKNIQVRHREMR